MWVFVYFVEACREFRVASTGFMFWSGVLPAAHVCPESLAISYFGELLTGTLRTLRDNAVVQNDAGCM